jgi:Integrase core domain
VHDSVAEARGSIGGYLTFYNHKRPHSSLNGWSPDQSISVAWRWRRPHDVRRRGDSSQENHLSEPKRYQTNPTTSVARHSLLMVPC